MHKPNVKSHPFGKLDWCRLEAPHHCSSLAQLILLHFPALVLHSLAWKLWFYSISILLRQVTLHFSTLSLHPEQSWTHILGGMLIYRNTGVCLLVEFLDHSHANPSQAEAISYEKKCIQGVVGHTDHHSQVWSKVRPVKMGQGKALAVSLLT